MYQINDRIKSINPDAVSYGKEGTVYEVTSSRVHVKFDDGSYGDCSREKGARYYQVISNQINKTNNKNMESIIKFAKNLVLSTDEKLLRKHGLKNDCGDYSKEAEQIVLTKLVKENEAYLVELATKAEEENKKD